MHMQPARRSATSTTSSWAQPLFNRNQSKLGRVQPLRERKATAKSRGGLLTVVCAEMHLPTDAFQGKSAEGKAAEMIVTLCTFAAVRIILAQEEGYDNEGGTRTQQYIDLVDMLNEEPMRNGTEWVGKLMQHPRTEMRLLAVRILEVREAFCSRQFDFEKLMGASLEGIRSENVAIMKKYLDDSLSAQPSQHEPMNEDPTV